jgi:hypothetical protein
LLYGSEIWAIMATDARRITAAQIEIYEKNIRIQLDRL